MTTTTTDTAAETVQNIPLTETPHATTVDAPPHPSPAATLKLISIGFSFFVAGVNDGSTGALLPYVIREYGISTAIVSSVYAPPPSLRVPSPPAPLTPCISPPDTAPTLPAGSRRQSPTPIYARI